MSSEPGTTEEGSLFGMGDKTELGFPLGGTGVSIVESSKRSHITCKSSKGQHDKISTDHSDAVTQKYNAGVLALHYHINVLWYIGTKVQH